MVIMDIDIIRKDFPLTKRVIYMNNASNAPMPMSSIKSMVDFMVFEEENGPDSKVVSEEINSIIIDTRRRLAKILRVKEDEIIFTQSTTHGINLVSKGLNIKKGDNIIIRDSTHEHPANYIPWKLLESKGITIKRLSIDDNGSIDLDELDKTIDNNTRLIVISHVLFNTGLILPIKDIAKIVKEHGSLLFIDGAQSVGCLDLDLSNINCDFLSFPGSKWLCGPRGIGILYCKRENQELLDPLINGLENSFINNEQILLKNIPERFEAGFRNYIGIVGLNASLKYIMNLGINNIRDRDIKLANMFRDGLNNLGVKLYGPEDSNKRSSIVSFAMDNIDNIINMLENNSIILAKRDINGKNIIRASPHFFNNEEEIAKVLNLLKH